jgi:hypothetical protein
MAAESFFFFLDKKEAKNQVSHDASFRTRPCPQSVKTTGCNLLPGYRAGLRFSKNLLCPSLRTAHQFYLISPEAYLLTNCVPMKNIATIKKKRWPVRVRGQEYGLCSGSDQPDLIFWLLLYQDKSNRLRGN